MNIEKKIKFVTKNDAIFDPMGVEDLTVIAGGIISDKSYFLNPTFTFSGTRFWNVWRKAYSYPIDKKFNFLGNKTFNFLNGILVLQDISFFREWREYEHIFRYYPQGVPFFNFGLRYDYFTPRVPPPDWVFEIKDSVRAKPKMQFSPRLGFSYRLNYLLLRINYGKFFQIPQFEYLYTNPFYNFERGYLPLFGNPDLKTSKTILIELSLSYLLSERQMISLNFYTREFSNLVDAIRTMSDTASLTDLTTGFTLYSDVGSAYIKDFELSWEETFPYLRWIFAFTWMKAEGSFGTRLEEPSYYGDVFIQKGEFCPLSWDQRYTLSIELTIGNLETQFMSFYLKWSSGFPYTPDGGPPNSERLPPNVETKFKLGKNIKNFFVGLVIDNVINRKNILWVDGKGRPGGAT